MRFIEEVLLPLLVCACLMGAVFVVISGLVVGANKIECSNLTEVTKRKTDFRWFGGCYVEHEGEMLPYERWKLLNVRVTNRN